MGWSGVEHLSHGRARRATTQLIAGGATNACTLRGVVAMDPAVRIRTQAVIQLMVGLAVLRKKRSRFRASHGSDSVGRCVMYYTEGFKKHLHVDVITSVAHASLSSLSRLGRNEDGANIQASSQGIKTHAKKAPLLQRTFGLWHCIVWAVSCAPKVGQRWLRSVVHWPLRRRYYKQPPTSPESSTVVFTTSGS